MVCVIVCLQEVPGGRPQTGWSSRVWVWGSAFCFVCVAGCYLWSGVFHVSCNASSAQPWHVCQAQFMWGQSSGGIVALLLGAALPSGGGQELQHSAHKTVHTESDEQTYQQRAVMKRLHSFMMWCESNFLSLFKGAYMNITGLLYVGTRVCGVNWQTRCFHRCLQYWHKCSV